MLNTNDAIHSSYFLTGFPHIAFGAVNFTTEPLYLALRSTCFKAAFMSEQSAPLDGSVASM